MNLKNEIRKANAAQANIDARPLPSTSIRREKSRNEREATYNPPGYGLHICLHSKTYYEPCSACKRTRSEALNNLSNL